MCHIIWQKCRFMFFNLFSLMSSELYWSLIIQEIHYRYWKTEDFLSSAYIFLIFFWNLCSFEIYVLLCKWLFLPVCVLGDRIQRTVARNTGMFRFTVLKFIAFHGYCVFYKLKVWSNPVSIILPCHFFLTAFVHFMSLYPILVILTVFQTFALSLHLL